MTWIVHGAAVQGEKNVGRATEVVNGEGTTSKLDWLNGFTKCRFPSAKSVHRDFETTGDCAQLVIGNISGAIFNAGDGGLIQTGTVTGSAFG